MDLLWDKDILTKDGDFATGENTTSHAEFILLASKGNFFWKPTLGVGLNNKINSELDPVELQGEITKELKSQKIKLISISENNNEYDIEVVNR